MAGRPTKYKAEYNEQVYKLCLLGATDKELADILNIAESTLNDWKNTFPEFSESIKKGKEKADAEVAEKLFHRAKGYEHEDEYITQYQGEPVVVPIIKHYPPDTAAAIFWLKNRQRDKWRDKQDLEIAGKDGGKIQVEFVEPQ